jgi:hypothetical protein
MFPYDAALLSAVQTTPQSIPDVLQTLQAIGATCADADGLKWFNWLYLEVTQAVEARVAAGEFTDAAWMAQLDVQFAGLYFSALKSSLAGEATPSCWQVLFDRRNQGAIARIQFALAGINAQPSPLRVRSLAQLQIPVERTMATTARSIPRWTA